MKTALVLAAFAIFLLVLIWQRSSGAAALAELQTKYDALAQENESLKASSHRNSAIHSALASGMPIAVRYRDKAGR